MELEQSKIWLKAKRDLEMVQMLGNDVSIKQGDVLEGLMIDLNGTELIGIELKGNISYYYGDVIRKEFDVIGN